MKKYKIMIHVRNIITGRVEEYLYPPTFASPYVAIDAAELAANALNKLTPCVVATYRIFEVEEG